MPITAELQKLMNDKICASIEMSGCYTFWQCKLKYLESSSYSRIEVVVNGCGDSLDDAVKEMIEKYHKAKKVSHAN